MLRVCLVIWRVLLGVVAMGESGAPDAGPCGAWSWQLAAQLLELGMLPCLGRGYDGFIDARGHATCGRNGPGMRPESAGKAPNSEDAALGCSFATRNAVYYVLA